MDIGCKLTAFNHSYRIVSRYGQSIYMASEASLAIYILWYGYRL